jgi:hypothetical protein
MLIESIGLLYRRFIVIQERQAKNITINSSVLVKKIKLVYICRIFPARRVGGGGKEKKRKKRKGRNQ